MKSHLVVLVPERFDQDLRIESIRAPTIFLRRSPSSLRSEAGRKVPVQNVLRNRTAGAGCPGSSVLLLEKIVQLHTVCPGLRIAHVTR